MEIASSQLRIIISQEYRQKDRYGKEASHADNKKCTKVLTSVQSLYPIPGIYIRRLKTRQAFPCHITTNLYH